MLKIFRTQRSQFQILSSRRLFVWNHRLFTRLSVFKRLPVRSGFRMISEVGSDKISHTSLEYDDDFG